VAALVIGGIVIVAVGEDPLNAYGAMWTGAFGGSDELAATMTRQLPLLLTGLSYAIAFQAGLINLGTEGQLYLGALAAGLAGYMVNLPWFLEIPTVILAGAVAGGLWGALAGWLRSQFKISEFLTTLMMNYIAIFFTAWAANGPFKDRTPESKGMIAQTQRIVESAQLKVILDGTRLHWGYIIGLVMVVALWWFLMKTRRGYEFRMHGLNPAFAEYGGINSSRVIWQAMFMAGAIAGIGGAIEVMGVHLHFVDQFSPGYGFDGVSAAILGSSTPIGTFVASFLFSALKTGSMGMDRMTRVPMELRNVVQATVIFFMASNMFGSAKDWFKRKSKKGASTSGSAA
jgi:simple sugar transport system permease protein